MARLKVVCSYLNEEGNGVASYNGLPLIVPNFLPNEEAEVQIIHKGYQKYFGRVLKLLKSSNDRVKEECVYASKCGGCHYQHIKYQSQLKFKLEMVNKLLQEAHINHSIKEIIGMDKPLFYRHKIMAPIKENKRGFYELNSHKFIPISTCLIENIIGQKVINSILEYNIEELSYIYVRVGKVTKEILLCLVSSSKEPLLNEKQITELVNRHNNIKTIVQSIKETDTNKVLGEKEIVLFGSGKIEDILCGNRFEISASSFYQINPQQTEILYRNAVDFAMLSKDDVVLDAYCGVGTISLIASKYCREIIGVEIVDEAIKNANKNKELNNIKNATFIQSDATDFILQNTNKFDVIFVDPPRKGCGKKFLESLIESKSRKIVYISCNPKSLVADLTVLLQTYDIKKFILVDMFPQTYHVECVCLLSLKDGENQ